MGSELLDIYINMSSVNKERFLKLLSEDLKKIEPNENKVIKKYNEVEISGDTYFVLDYDAEKDEATLCMKSIMSKEDVKKYFTDKWYVDGCYDVRYSSDIKNNEFNDSYIYEVLNGSFKNDKLKSIELISDVRIPTKEEIENIDMEYRETERYGFWTMTPYNNMQELENGSNACVFAVHSNGTLGHYSVNFRLGVRPVFKVKGQDLK